MFGKIKKRRKDVASFDDVDDFRIKMNLKKKEMMDLMGLSASQWRNCEKKGGFLAYRFYGAIDALENHALHKALNQIKLFNDAKQNKIED